LNLIHKEFEIIQTWVIGFALIASQLGWADIFRLSLSYVRVVILGVEKSDCTLDLVGITSWEYLFLRKKV
jgi:hypothetical protein